MAKQGTRKALSQEHEDHVAKKYGGTRSKSSGGHVTDEGDVRVTATNTLFECKGKFGKLTGNNPVSSTLLKQFTKVASEAYEVGKDPAVALRFYVPDHWLADRDGYIDLVVRLLADDAYRAYSIAAYQEQLV